MQQLYEMNQFLYRPLATFPHTIRDTPFPKLLFDYFTLHRI
ncbi:hypothetical protein [Bacillus altitudinis]|nr:hypothetical protein [Bacillus altitudinis]